MTYLHCDEKIMKIIPLSCAYLLQLKYFEELKHFVSKKTIILWTEVRTEITFIT